MQNTRLYLHDEALSGTNTSFEIYQLLLKYGADVDSIYDSSISNTILMHLCSKEATKSTTPQKVGQLLRFLLEQGANRLIKNIYGEDAMRLLDDNPRGNQFRKIILSTEKNKGVIRGKANLREDSDLINMQNISFGAEKKGGFFCC